MAESPIKIRFWFWVYRWSQRLADYSENKGDTQYAAFCNVRDNYNG